MLRDELIDTLRELALEDPQVQALFLGGSLGEGAGDAHSDIDLILVRASGSSQDGDDGWEQRVTELARLVTAWTGNDGRIVEYAEEEFRAAAAAGEPLLRDVAKQGLTVAGTRAWLNAQLRGAARRS